MSLVDAPALDLPPLVAHRPAPPGADPFDHACAVAADAGAGTLIWTPEAARLAFAVVLEPDAPRAEARRAFLAGMAALGDALAAACPPEKKVAFLWPDVVTFDGARLGGGRFALAEGERPDWAVFGAELLRARPGLTEAGLAPDSTSLIEEGFDPDEAILESFARHLMLYADHWAHSGFGPIAEGYLNRLADPGREARIGREGDLTAAGRPRRPLPAALDGAAWRDPATGGPRL